MSHGAAPRAAEKRVDNLLRIEVETIESASAVVDAIAWCAEPAMLLRPKVSCEASPWRSSDAKRLGAVRHDASTVLFWSPSFVDKGVRAVPLDSSVNANYYTLSNDPLLRSARTLSHPHTIDSKTNKSTLLLREMYWLLGICANRQRCSRRSY